MNFKSKKTSLITIISIIFIIVISLVVSKYSIEKANKEKAIELAENHKLHNYYLGKHYVARKIDGRIDFLNYGKDIIYATTLMMDDPKIYKQLGWDAKKVTEDIYYTTLGYRYANSDEIYKIAFQVNLNLQRCKFINKTPYLKEYYKENGYIKENDILKSYDNNFIP